MVRGLVCNLGFVLVGALGAQTCTLTVGVIEVIVRVPDGARSGPVPVILSIGQFQSQTGVTAAVQ